MTENNHEILKRRMTGPEPLILYFSAEPCTVCHAMLPKLQKALLEMGEAQEGQDYHLMVIESEQHPEICGQLLVFTVPTILIFWEGREILRESRFMDLNQVTRILSQIIESRSSRPGLQEV